MSTNALARELSPSCFGTCRRGWYVRVRGGVRKLRNTKKIANVSTHASYAPAVLRNLRTLPDGIDFVMFVI